MPQPGADVPHFASTHWCDCGRKPRWGWQLSCASVTRRKDEQPAADAARLTRRFFRRVATMDKHAMLRYGIKRRRALERLRLIEAEEAAILARFPDLAEPAPRRPSQARAQGGTRGDATTGRAERLGHLLRIPRIRVH
jgi:hypothetical protein